MARRLTLLASLVLLVAPACSGDDDDVSGPGAANGTTGPGVAATDPPSTDENDNGTSPPLETSPSDRIGCRVKVSGDVSTEFTAKDDLSAFSSDYYLSQGEIDEALGFFSDLGTDIASDLASDFTEEEEPDFTVPPRPEGAAPLVAWFLLNCQGGDITISFYSNANATDDDVPFGSGDYEIAPGSVLGEDDPKQFSALVAFGADPSVLWVTDEGGSIDIDRFDRTGAEGSFAVPMREATIGGGPSEKAILIEGTFEVTCKDGANCDG